METLGIDLFKLTAVIISHNHWDHTRGIPLLLDKLTQKIIWYVPASDVPEIKSIGDSTMVQRVTGALQITDSIWSTGEMQGAADGDLIYEQSVIINSGEFVYLFTGCAHPGIVSIVEKTHELFPDKKIALAGGGFHLIDKTPEQLKEISDRLFALNVERLAPSHCTGDKAIAYLRAEWGDRFIDLHLGDNYKI
jgi:7,8-dihydropterin-6-yl-methyl-4-(beta-D-ribofuranosyl)aminobenzene 5'-phosphate synthase